MRWFLATLLLCLTSVANAVPAINQVIAAADSDCCGHDAESRNDHCPLGCGLADCVCVVCPLRAPLQPAAVSLAPDSSEQPAPLFPAILSPALDASDRRIFHPPKA